LVRDQRGLAQNRKEVSEASRAKRSDFAGRIAENTHDEPP
jgi:hypothetical protein